MKYINFNKKEQTRFMRSVKERTSLSWEKLASFLGISRSMIFVYLDGSSKIPKENYEKLCNISRLRKSYNNYVEIRNKVETIKKPSLNEHLAELIGILAGDGHISKYNYEIVVSGHLMADKDYILGRVSLLFRNLFNVNVKIKKYKPNNNLRCVINSKELSEFLTGRYKLPLGKKMRKLHIPKKIKLNKKFLQSYLRGLFDTDGSIYLRRNESVVSIISRDKAFLEEVRKGFENLGFRPSISGKNLYLYNQSGKFFSEISPANTKHLLRYKKFMRKGH
ncbi:LAGLIDADG family homing endonuclease [Nanoarchaeota archaeon]